MGILPASYFLNDKQHGMTLIEVLIALAIISIAMTAIIKAASQNIRGTHHLQEKSLSLWAGEEVMNEIRMGTLRVGSDQLKQTTTVLGQEWFIEAGEEATPNERIKKITVNVLQTADSESPVMTLESYK